MFLVYLLLFGNTMPQSERLRWPDEEEDMGNLLVGVKTGRFFVQRTTKNPAPFRSH